MLWLRHWINVLYVDDFFTAILEGSSFIHLKIKIGFSRTRVQYLSSDHGYSLYAFCRIFLFRQCWKGYIWTLWSCEFDLHSFHKSDSTLCWYVTFKSLFFFLLILELANLNIRRPCTSSAISCDWLLASPCNFTFQISCGARFGRC